MVSYRDFAVPQNNRWDGAMKRHERRGSMQASMRMRKRLSIDASAGAVRGFLGGNPGSISAGYPQFFENWGEKFKKYERFRL